MLNTTTETAATESGEAGNGGGRSRRGRRGGRRERGERRENGAAENAQASGTEEAAAPADIVVPPTQDVAAEPPAWVEPAVLGTTGVVTEVSATASVVELTPAAAVVEPLPEVASPVEAPPAEATGTPAHEPLSSAIAAFEPPTAAPAPVEDTPPVVIADVPREDSPEAPALPPVVPAEPADDQESTLVRAMSGLGQATPAPAPVDLGTALEQSGLVLVETSGTAAAPLIQEPVQPLGRRRRETVKAEEAEPLQQVETRS